MMFKLPQVIYIAILTLSVGVSFLRDGMPKTGRYSMKEDMISVAIEVGLLWWGGFFC